MRQIVRRGGQRKHSRLYISKTAGATFFLTVHYWCRTNCLNCISQAGIARGNFLKRSARLNQVFHSSFLHFHINPTLDWPLSLSPLLIITSIQLTSESECLHANFYSVLSSLFMIGTWASTLDAAAKLWSKLPFTLRHVRQIWPVKAQTARQ